MIVILAVVATLSCVASAAQAQSRAPRLPIAVGRRAIERFESRQFVAIVVSCFSQTPTSVVCRVHVHGTADNGQHATFEWIDYAHLHGESVTVGTR